MLQAAFLLSCVLALDDGNNPQQFLGPHQENPKSHEISTHSQEDATAYEGSCKDFVGRLFQNVKPDAVTMKQVADDMNIVDLSGRLENNPLRIFMDSVLKNPPPNFDALEQFYLQQSKKMVYRDTICKFIHTAGTSCLDFITDHEDELRYFIHRVYLLEAYTVDFLSNKTVARVQFDNDHNRPMVKNMNAFKKCKLAMLQQGTAGYFKNIGDRAVSNKWLRINVEEAAFLSNWQQGFPSAAKTGMRLSAAEFIDVRAKSKKLDHVTSSLTNDELLRTIGCGGDKTAQAECEDSFVISRRNPYGYWGSSDSSAASARQSWSHWVELYNVWNLAIVIKEVQHWKSLMTKLFIPSVMAPNDMDDWVGYRVISLWKAMSDYGTNYKDDPELFNPAWDKSNEPELFRYVLDVADAIKLPHLAVELDDKLSRPPHTGEALASWVKNAASHLSPEPGDLAWLYPQKIIDFTKWLLNN